MLGGLGAPELIVIALIALLLFGAGRIADIGKGLGQGIKNFKQGLKEASEDDDSADAKREKTAEKSAKVDKAKKKEEATEEARRCWVPDADMEIHRRRRQVSTGNADGNRTSGVVVTPPSRASFRA